VHRPEVSNETPHVVGTPITPAVDPWPSAPVVPLGYHASADIDEVPGDAGAGRDTRPGAGSSTPLLSTLEGRRRLMTRALVGLGIVMVLALGGAAATWYTYGRAQAKPRAAASWTKLPKAPKPLEGAAVTAFQQKVWVAGGVSPDGGRPRLADVQIYDPATRSWSSGPPLPAAVSHAALVGSETELYLIGGLVERGSTPDVLRLDTSTGTWQPAPALPGPRGAGAAAWDGSKIVFAGGVRPDHRAADDVWALENDQWRRLGSLQLAREKLTAVSDEFGTVWFLGGRDPFATPPAAMGLVDVVSVSGVHASTAQIEPRIAPAGFYLAGAGPCVVGGEFAGGFSASISCVDATKNTGQPQLSNARGGLGAATVDKVVYVVGGYGAGRHGSGDMESLSATG
jgi:Kelch motif protein